ncbi:MAG TPA: YCF48-related protein [Solimonas sp.]
MRSLVVLLGLALSLSSMAADVSRSQPAEMAPRASQALLTRITAAGSQLVAVGARGHILRSTDGAQWTQSASPVNALLTSVFFLDARQGWAVGHDATILQTDDGGDRWTIQHFDPSLNLPLLDIVFTSPQRGVAIGAYGLMLQTEDGGRSWTRTESALTEEGLHFNALSRLRDGALLLVGEQGMLAHSKDEGRTWQRLESPYASSLFAAVPWGEHGAMIGGLRGNVYRSEAADIAGWQRIDLPRVESVFGMAVLPDGGVGLVGLNTSLQIVDADGSVPALRWSISTAQTGIELGSLSSLVPWNDRIVSVGDAGVIVWSLTSPH